MCGWDKFTDDDIKLFKKNAGETLSKKIKNNEIIPGFTGKHVSEEHKTKLRILQANKLKGKGMKMNYSKTACEYINKLNKYGWQKSILYSSYKTAFKYLIENEKLNDAKKVNKVILDIFDNKLIKTKDAIKQAIYLAEQTNDKSTLSSIYQSAYVFYKEFNEIEHASKYLNMSVMCNPNIDSDWDNLYNLNFLSLFLEEGDLDSARIYANKLRNEFKSIYVIGTEITSAPPKFPAVSLVQTNNAIQGQYATFTSLENVAKEDYKAEVYSNLITGKEAQTKEITEVISDVMCEVNYERTFCEPIPNADATIHRRMSRYTNRNVI